MPLFQQMVKTSCLALPPALTLGRHFQLTQICWWYGHEMGLEYEMAERFFLASQDDLALLLTRLCQRGAIWGWGDGGYGEGLLGWLGREECLRLAEGLAAYDLSPIAPVPNGLTDLYLIQIS